MIVVVDTTYREYITCQKLCETLYKISFCIFNLIHHLIFTKIPRDRFYYYFHFIDEKTKLRKTIYLRTHKQEGQTLAELPNL